MRTIFDCICCRCQRVIKLEDILVFEGRDYHDACYLQVVRTRIAQLDKKAQNGTITLLDNHELGDLLFIEKQVRYGAENKTPFIGESNPVFFGNTSLGSFCAMNPPAWKRLKSFDGTKYHMMKSTKTEPEFLPIFDIRTDEIGHKFCVQIGRKSNPAFIPSFPLEKNIRNCENVGKKELNMNAKPSLYGLPQKIDDSVDTKMNKDKTS